MFSFNQKKILKYHLKKLWRCDRLILADERTAEMIWMDVREAEGARLEIV
jgi:hypothetical protein